MVTTSIKMIEVFMLVSLILCFNDIILQCYLELARRQKKSANKVSMKDHFRFKLKKQAIFDITMNPGQEVFYDGNTDTKKKPV